MKQPAVMFGLMLLGLQYECFMKDFSYEYCEEKDIIYLSNIDCKQLINEYSILKDSLNGADKTYSADDGYGNTLKENRGIFLCDVYTPEYSFMSPAGRIFEKIFKEISRQIFPIKSAMNYFKSSEGINVLLSEYKKGNYYKPHRDTSSLTMLIWPMPKTFTGGDLVLVDFNHKIFCEQGTGVIFPSHYLHESEEIICDNETDAKVTYTAFV